MKKKYLKISDLLLRKIKIIQKCFKFQRNYSKYLKVLKKCAKFASKSAKLVDAFCSRINNLN